MQHGTRWAPLVVSLTLLIGLGAFGLSLVRSSHEAAEQALGEGSVEKQQTVAALTNRYLQLAAKEAFEVTATHPLELTPGSPADAEVLSLLIDEQGGFFGHGALLTDLGGCSYRCQAASVSDRAGDSAGVRSVRMAS